MSNETQTMTESPTSREKMVELLRSFKNVMVVTRSGEKDHPSLRSRPMAVAKVEDNCDLWFITRTECAVTDETTVNHEMNVCAQESERYLSVSGLAHIVDDRPMIKQLWRDEWEKWIPLKYEDPNIVLIKLDSKFGEYWDYSGLGRKLQFAFDSVKAALKHERPEYKGEHEKVTFVPEESLT